MFVYNKKTWNLGGDYKTGRYNEGGKDLNRDFPTWRDTSKSLNQNMKGRQPETKVLGMIKSKKRDTLMQFARNGV